MDDYLPAGFTPTRVALADLGRAVDRVGDLAKDGGLSGDELRRLRMLQGRIVDLLLDAADARKVA